MFEDITQMEKEIETFRKNILASSELVDGIAHLTDATKKQKDSFEASSGDLLKKMDSFVKQIKSDHKTALQTLSSENKDAIQTLQKNMTAEQADRIKELEDIKKELLEQQAAFAERIKQTEKALEDYQEKLVTTADQIKADHDTSLHTLGERVSASVSELQENMAADLEARVAAIDRIKAVFESCQAESSNKADEQIQRLVKECERLIAQMKSELAEQQTLYAEKLQQTEKLICEYQNTAEHRYNDFVQRLETTNVDQLIKEMQDLKQSIQTKFMILLGGIGVTLIVTLLGLILK